jgi:large subunit ribosomal protein L21
MYAIVEIGGRQVKVEKGVSIAVNRLAKKESSDFKSSHILFARKGNAYHIGNPYIKGAHVDFEVMAHTRGKKVIAFKYKRRKSYHRKVGHRQDLTVLKVKEIHV